jgi:hypothetical protein
MATAKFQTLFYLRIHYRAICDDPDSTVEQKFTALKALERLMVRKKHPGSKTLISIHARKQKASPLTAEKPVDVVGKVDSKLLGAVEE